MKKFLTLLALATLSFNAAAHGPTPQKVEKTIVIKAAPAKTWALVKDFGNMQSWHPAVASSKLEKKGTDVFRTLTLKNNGGEIYEKLRSADDKDMKLKYEIVSGVAPVADYNSTMTVTAGPGAGESTVTWVGRFYRTYKLNPPIPAGQDDETAFKFVEGVYDSGLANMKKVLESSK
ncbi:MAG: MxaD protein [Methylotenera sp.]|nr:SRPBCC family protein [Methylotenera sp.]OQW70639.1 MAG: MxaD protein [Proteobacteria bacterium ST_bin12]PPC86414.1 MAG: MxaD protein [Methylotenera sp.]PPD56041.1 MAG: MxaD protein [Methylotenera sp.]